ncbi:MAG: DUF2948 family protein [Hyphomicrobiales bacterium]|nr:DUF2948 family protein [Hyphomicrobiales bacterium]
MDPLKLIALDEADLNVVSAHLQDAVSIVADLAYLPSDRRFVAMFNRFDWSTAVASGRGERRQAALRIEQVRSARTQGIDFKASKTVLSLLALTFTPDPDPDKAPQGDVTLQFAGGAAIKLQVECVEVQLEDLGPAWRARAVPRHEPTDGDAGPPAGKGE